MPRQKKVKIPAPTRDNRGANNPNWRGGLAKRTCEICGLNFGTKQKAVRAGGGKYCSKDCRAKGVGVTNSRNAPRKRVLKFCVICAKEIRVKPSHANTEGVYCSKICMAKGYTKRQRGETNPNWKGGSTFVQCQKCNRVFVRAHGSKKAFCSLGCAAIERIQKDENFRSYYKGGKRADLNNLFVRSSWEANYARYLNWLVCHKKIITWDFEPDTFEFVGIKRGSRFYLPDFRIKNNDGTIEYHEVKGYMDAASRTKLRRMAKYHPLVKVVLIEKKLYKEIEKKVSALLPHWEY